VGRLAVLLAVSGLLVAGCSGSSESADAPPVQPEEVTRAAVPAVVEVTARTPYTRALEQLCVRRLRAQEKVGRAQTPEELERTLPTTSSIDRRFVRDLSALRPRPSASEKKRAERLVVLFAALTDMQDTALVHLKADNVNGFFQYLDRSVTTRRTAERVARGLGAPACAVRPFAR
jgi:hypothetical protein